MRCFQHALHEGMLGSTSRGQVRPHPPPLHACALPPASMQTPGMWSRMRWLFQCTTQPRPRREKMHKASAREEEGDATFAGSARSSEKNSKAHLPRAARQKPLANGEKEGSRLAPKRGFSRVEVWDWVIRAARTR